MNLSPEKRRRLDDLAAFLSSGDWDESLLREHLSLWPKKSGFTAARRAYLAACDRILAAKGGRAQRWLGAAIAEAARRFEREDQRYTPSIDRWLDDGRYHEIGGDIDARSREERRRRAADMFAERERETLRRIQGNGETETA